MSPDALTNLVRRTLAPIPPVSPLLSSRFEAEQAAPAVDLERDEETTAPQLEPTDVSTDVPHVPDLVRRAEAAADPIPVRPPDVGPERERVIGRQHVAAQPEATPQIAAMSTADDLRADNPHPEPESPRPANHPETLGASERAQPSTPVRPREPVATAAPGAAKVERAAPVAPLTVDIPIATEDNPRQEPIVHITIGRIEVRPAAPQRPAAPPRKTYEKRVMSLDEYLERRGRGSS